MFESLYGEHCTLAVHLVTEHIERFAFAVGKFHFSKHINVSEEKGGYVNKG